MSEHTADYDAAERNLTCGCGHPMSDHARDQTGACMAPYTEKYDCPCISVWVTDGDDDE